MASDPWLARRLRIGPPRRLAVPRTPESGRGQRAPRRLVVCGDDPLAHRLIEELISRYGAEITAVLPSRRRNHGPQISRIPGVRVIEADRLDADVFRQARVPVADGLALVKQDDVGNIHAALQAQELNPGLRVVIRMFNMSLGHTIRRLLTDCAVMSDASMAAPSFVSAALGEVAPVHFRMLGRTLLVARRRDVRAHDVVCGLAAGSDEGSSELLPADQGRADLVLAVANRQLARRRPEDWAAPGAVVDDQPGPEEPEDRSGWWPPRLPSVRWPGRWRRWWRRRRRNPFGGLRALVDRKLRVAALALIALLAIGTGVLAGVSGIPWWDAAYLTIMTSLGGANADVDARAGEKIIQTLLTVFSIALIPVLTAAVVDAVVNARLALALGRLKKPIADHVVVIGLGNVGTRVIRQLHELGVPVVAIDKSQTALGMRAARELGIPCFVGDASQLETLRGASVETATALLALSTDDVTNLEAALQARTLKPDLRVVLRLFDGDFADRVQRAFGITISRSVSFVAAPAFAAALMERDVIGTIPINRTVLTIAEAPVCAGSELDGAAVSMADEVGEVRVIAMSAAIGGKIIWSPPKATVLRPDDVLVVVATRAGLGRILGRTAGLSPAAEPAG